MGALFESWPATVTDATAARVRIVLERFTHWCDALGAVTVDEVTPQLARGFVMAPLPDGRTPFPATMDGRRAALRVLFRHLRGEGVSGGDPTLDMRVPGRVRRGARPLTDEEVVLGRITAQLRSRSGGGYATVGWALAEAGAMTSEICKVRLGDLDSPTAPERVWLSGTRRHDARRAELTDWGSDVLARHAAELRTAGRGQDSLLAYRGRAATGSPASQSAMCTSLRAVLLQAGLAQDEDDVRPASIRHWAGRSRYEAGMPLERVARWLGARSLDAVAYDLAIDWHGLATGRCDQEADGPDPVAPVDSAGSRLNVGDPSCR